MLAKLDDKRTDTVIAGLIKQSKKLSSELYKSLTWDSFNEDEKYRAPALAITGLRAVFDELVAYYDGMVTENEWLSLQWNLKLAAKRPNFASAYELCKDSYPKFKSIGSP